MPYPSPHGNRPHERFDPNALPAHPPHKIRNKEPQKLIHNEGFKAKLLKYEPEEDKSTTGSFMVPFFASNSKTTGRDLIDGSIDSLIHAFSKQSL